MSWWTAVPGLTPVAAWDAAHYELTGVSDLVGSNLMIWPDPVVNSFELRRLKGKSTTVYLQTPIQLPAQYTMLLFARPLAKSVFFSRSNTHQSAVWVELNGQYASRNDANSFTNVSGPAPNGQQLCVALVRGASSVSLFVNGVALSTTIPIANCPDVLGRVAGWRDNNEPDYALTAEADFYGAGVWAGAAAQEDVQALEAALRAELVGEPATYRAFLPLLGRQNNEVPNALLLTAQAYNRAGVMGWRNIYQGGAGRVAGTVKYTPNSPVHRKVRLIEQATGLVVREAWSDPITGAYSFDYVDLDPKYTVLSYDYTGAYRAVVADGIVPEVIA